MALNSSNVSLHLPPLSSSYFEKLHRCFTSGAGISTLTAFTITSFLLLLPLYILVLYLGYQRWRQQSLLTAASHSDFFTYNVVIIELISLLGSTLTCVGVHTGPPEMVIAGIYLISMNLTGQLMYHLLTCLERYLAVVHPVTYLGLRNTNGIRLRNITIGCVWLMCFALLGSIFVANDFHALIMSSVVVAFGVSVISFCSISVLCALIRPGPGDRAGAAKQRFDKSKLRAFYTIIAILGVLLLRFGGNMFSTTIDGSSQMKDSAKCGLWVSVLWFSMPSSLVLPLLFLHRVGKLSCCKNDHKSGQGSV